MTTQFLLSLLPWLAILACPAFMMWMMRGATGAGGKPQASGGDASRDDGDATTVRPERMNVEIAELRKRLEQLEASRMPAEVQAATPSALRERTGPVEASL